MIKSSVRFLAVLALCVAVLSGCAAPADTTTLLTSPSPSSTATTPPAGEEHLSFNASYHRTNGYVEGKVYPVVTLVQSTQERDAYYNAVKDTQPISTDTLRRYDDAFFKNHLLIIVLLEEGSGSVRHKVTDVVQTDSSTRVLIQRILPDGDATADMAEWHILIEIDRQGYAGTKAEAVIDK